MKTIKNSLLVCLLGMLVMSLTSCDPDIDKGTMLSGRWFGDLGMMVDGHPARGSVLELVPESWDCTSGYGTETDYYGRYGTLTVRHRFDWFVDRGVIYLRFDNPDLNCTISRYSLSSDFFRGYMDGAYETSYFTLRAREKYWNNYGYGCPDYDYGYWYDEYYVRGEQPTQGTASAGKPLCQRRQNLSPAE